MFSDWTGRRITLPTKEWHDGVMRVINADFRAYDSFNESIDDHNKLLCTSRYKILDGCLDYKTACEKIFECGYATDPGYAVKFISIIEENRLYEFDEFAGSTKGNKILRFQKLSNKLEIRDSEGKALEEDNILGEGTH